MQTNQSTIKDKDLQVVIGTLLRWGVWSALSITALGGILYLIEHGNEPVNYPKYSRIEESLPSVLHGISSNLAAGNMQVLILIGILVLFATPILRVIFSLIGFILEKDKLYIIITLIVLGIIVVSVSGGLG